MAINKGTQYITDPDSIPVNTSTGQQDVSEALDSRVIYVKTIADLQAIPTAGLVDGQQISITTTGRAGDFVVLAGDYSTEVANDPQSGIWVKFDDAPATTIVAKRILGDILNFDIYEPDKTGATDTIAALNTALVVADGRPVVMTPGVYGQGVQLDLPDRATIIGANFATEIKCLPGYVGDIAKTENFDSLTGTNTRFNGEPEYIRIEGVRFNGNYQTDLRDAYVRTSGDGLKLYCRKLHLDIEVFNVPGIGLFSELGKNGRPSYLPVGYSNRGKIRLYIHGTKEEGLIWKGPADVKIDSIFQTAAGSQIFDDDYDGKISSPTYGSTNGGVTDGVVFESGAEIELIHSWGNLHGGGITVYGGRIDANLLMSESNHYGGINLKGGYGMISQIELHNTGGYWPADGSPDDTPCLDVDAPAFEGQGYTIGEITVKMYPYDFTEPENDVPAGNSLNGPHDAVRLGPNSRRPRVGMINVAGRNFPCNGLYVDAGALDYSIGDSHIDGCSNAGPGTGTYAGIVRNSSGGDKKGLIRATVQSCDTALIASGTPKQENLDIYFILDTGDAAFSGDWRSTANRGQDWSIRGTINNIYYGNKAKGSLTFDSTITSVQSASFTHNLLNTPNPEDVMLSMVDAGTKMSPNVGAPTYFMSGFNSTDITVDYQQAASVSPDTAPIVAIWAEI